jgi:hypothetical protein
MSGITADSPVGHSKHEIIFCECSRGELFRDKWQKLFEGPMRPPHIKPLHEQLNYRKMLSKQRNCGSDNYIIKSILKKALLSEKQYEKTVFDGSDDGCLPHYARMFDDRLQEKPGDRADYL